MAIDEGLLLAVVPPKAGRPLPAGIGRRPAGRRMSALGRNRPFPRRASGGKQPGLPGIQPVKTSVQKHEYPASLILREMRA